MKHVFISTAAAALLLASQGAFAQPRGERGEGPGAGAQMPGPGPSQGPGAGPGHSGEAPGRAGPPAHAPGPPANPGVQRGNSANAPGHNPARAEQQQPQRTPQQHAQPQAPQKTEQQRTGEHKQQPTPPRADIKGKDADTNRTARDNATPKSDSKDVRKEADRSHDRDLDRNRSETAGKDGKDNAHGDRMAGSQDLRQARERLDTQERTRLHQAFDRQGARVNVRVNVHVGSRVPRNIHLVRVPQTVVSFFPYYRDYSYFVEGETVYIVNPRSYEVVDVIDEGYGRAHPVQQHARLNLSDRQIAMVQEAIAAIDIRPENLHLRLALGAEIPRDVELHRFPGRVLDDVRELEGYRFVMVEDQIVIVSPDDRSIALVIDRT